MNDTIRTINNRHSTRGPFEPNHTIPNKDLQAILDAARWSPTAHNMQNFEIILVNDPSILEQLAAIKAPITQTFITENYQQLSFSEDELQRKKTGILGTMFPDYMRNPKIKPTTEEHNESFQGSLVTKNPVFLVVLYDPKRRAPASEGDFLGIISLGCIMENMWLAATSLGITCHIISSFNDDPAATQTKKILKIPAQLSIAFTMRLGYTKGPQRSLRVRRDIKDFTYHNHYGTHYQP